MKTLREQLQITRINRTRTRVHAWWHATHCATCAARAGGVSFVPLAIDELLKRLGAEPEAAEAEAPAHPKAH